MNEIIKSKVVPVELKPLRCGVTGFYQKQVMGRLILQLPCPSDKCNDDQGDGQWQEETDVAITVRAKMIKLGDFVERSIV